MSKTFVVARSRLADATINEYVEAALADVIVVHVFDEGSRISIE